jgi:hypothetical protein
VKRIEQWSTELCPHKPYLAPELHDHVHVAGIIDGKEKITTRVVAVDGRKITTKTGSVYLLGKAKPEFSAWCAMRGTPIDPAQPIKLTPAGRLS